MQEFEILQLINLEQQKVAEQFQFWMATTFAVVIASYTAGDRLVMWARLVIAALYLLAATLFYVRYMHSFDVIGQLFPLLSDSSVVLPGGEFASLLRRTVMIGGSLMALVLICFPAIAEIQRKEPES